MWTVGNTNRQVIDSDSDDDDEDEEDEEGNKKKKDENGSDDGEEEEEEDKDPFAISDDSEDEAQMAEIRQKTLNSKSFQNPSIDDDDHPAKQPEKVTRPDHQSVLREDSDAESGSAGSEDDDDEAFDNIINATPVTDRTGIISKSRRKGKETFSASFSRTVVNAPKRW